MRTALLSLLICTAAAPAWGAPAVPRAVVPAAVTAQLAQVETARQRALWRAYPDALLELARRYQTAGLLKQARDAADKAATVYDQQLELHRDLSEALSDPVRGKAERTAARELGLARDSARFFAAQLAEQLGDADQAVSSYLLVVRSQPGEGLGLDALAALKSLNWLAPSAPASPAVKTP